MIGEENRLGCTEKKGIVSNGKKGAKAAIRGKRERGNKDRRKKERGGERRERQIGRAHV